MIEIVQSGTLVHNTTGNPAIQTVTLGTSVDMTKSVLIFQTRSNSNRPVASELRGRLASATTIEFVRVTDEVAPVAINIQWYLATFGSGVRVQRGDFSPPTVTSNVTLGSAVAAVNQAFVLWSKSPTAVDTTWADDDFVLGELTTTTNLQFRTNLVSGGGHTVSWQVVEFTTAADITVQKGTIATLTGATLSVTATLSPAVNVNKTFVLAGIRTTAGTGPDIGARMVRAVLTNSTTITFDRAVGTTADITEIAWQAVELKDASIVWRGSANFASGVGVAAVTTGFPDVNLDRAVGLISTQGGGGQNMGRSSYVGDDIVGVATATTTLANDTITLTRNNTASAADVGWFVVQFDGGSGLKVGSFTKTAAAGPVTQVIAHGLGQVPKAVILWTEGRPDASFSGIAFRSPATQSTAATGVLTLTINKPAGTVAGDVMVASIGVSQAAAATITAAGWTLAPAGRISNAGITINALAVYYKVAGAAEPATYNFTFSASTGSAGGIQTFSGVDTVNPIDTDAGLTHVSSLLSVAPAVTTTANNAMIVRSHTFSSSATWTITAGTTGTETIDAASVAPQSTNGQSIEVNYFLQETLGGSGTQTATASGNAATGIAHTLALRASAAYMGFGMTDGTTSKSVSASTVHAGSMSNTATQIANKALTIVTWDTATTGIVIAEADLQSWDSTNFTLNWTTNAANAPYIVHYIAIGGTSVSAKVIPWTLGTAVNASLGVTGVGFQPNVVLHAHASYLQTLAPPTTALSAATPPTTLGVGAFGLGAMDAEGNQWANGFVSVDNVTTSDTQRGQRTDSFLYSFDESLTVQKKASFKSMDVDGFTVNVSNATSNKDTQVISLALAGLNAQVGSLLKSTTTPNFNQQVPGVNFQPNLVLLTSVQDLTQAGAPTVHSRFGIGASDGTTEGSSAFSDTDGLVTTSVFAVDKTTKAFIKLDTNTAVVAAEADVTVFDATGFWLNWSTNDNAATQILYLALAPMSATEVRLISLNGTRYNSRVLVQWQTGYEIDNLGFNLYREINNVRTKVNTSSLIAGSGLQAGRGGVVTATQSYARWDVDAAAADPTTVYWLEDVDFNGRSRWNGPFTPVDSTLSEPSTVDSDELGDIGNATSSRRIFFNYNEDAVHPGPRAAPAPVAPEVTTQWALASQPTVKIGIRKPGWYLVTQAELLAAGLGSQVDPRTLKLFVDGIEQAMRVNGETDGVFNSGDTIEFYASGIETPATDTRIYWLQAGGQSGRRIAVDSGGPFDPSGLTGFSSTLRRKERSVYMAALNNGDAENWFGPLVRQEPAIPPDEDPDGPWAAALTLTPNHIDRSVAGATAHVTVSMQGVTVANHQVGVLVNGQPLDEMTFAGQIHAEQAFPVDVNLLADGENTITLVARGGVLDKSLVDLIRLDYPHTYQADADRLRFSVDAPGSITVGGFASASIRVFDITDRTAPVQLPATIGSSAGLSTVTVQVPGTGPRTLMAFSDETVSTPQFVRSNHPSTLHASGNAFDYVVISHADFLVPVAPLVAHRQAQGHHAVVVDIEDVYDEFSFGEKTPQALKDFLQWAYTNWTLAPRFVVLAGDATIDPRDYEGLGNADFVPTKNVAMAHVSLETASDDWFVDFGNNGIPYVAIGRLPVRTAAQAAAMVGKIIGYDSTPSQTWQKDVLLVADQNDDGADFERFSENLSALLPPAYTARTVFRGRLGDTAAHQALTDRINGGALIVNYTGHGSVGFWAGNTPQLLTNDDVPSWTNGARLPFIVAMNCLNGLFNGIYGESLAETLVRAPDGGAVAAWASSSLTPAATQALVNEELFRIIFSGTYATLGEAVVVAKRVVSNQDLRRSWIFFGDPATRLSGVPQVPVPSTIGPPPAITTQPVSGPIASGQRAVLTITATGTGPLAYQWYSRTSRTTMSAISGATSSGYTSSPQTSTVSYLVRVSNSSGFTDSSIAVVSTPPIISTPGQWPSATAAVPYTLALAAENSTPPYAWASTTLPSGLKLDGGSGEIFDAPNAAGTFTFVVRVTGADGVSTEKTFSLVVNAATDVFLAGQWHLKSRSVEVAGANVESVWPTTRGAGVVIGIVDDGLQSTHPDLQANYVAGLSYDFADHDADPNPVTTGACGTQANCQGTWVAGIAAARGDNGSGGSGVAPLASLAGIRLAAHVTDVDEAAAFAHELDAVAIENQSWHRADDGQTLAAPGPLAEAALANAIVSGRSGKGRIFVWAAGDGGASDNCNFDAYANSRFGIAVGAVDDTGLQPPYSESCSALLVSAPSSGGARSLTTTDLVGTDGSDPNDYTTAFGGTSAAAPVVSGVVALMLARNPALTWRDVQHILARTSRKINPNDSSWTAGWVSHSEHYGFGNVDAMAAVHAAAMWVNVAAESTVPPVTHPVAVAIPDDSATGVSDSISVGPIYGRFSVEHVEVEFNATHPHRGDLEVSLTSPAGVVSHLGTVRPGDGGANFNAWRFRSVRHWGESAAGTWKLTVADRAAGNTGIFDGWTLKIYGTALPVGAGAMTSAWISADKTSPQLPGTTMTFTADGAGGMTPYSFKFFVTTNNWATFSILRDWSTTPTVAWTPTTPGSYQVGVWARREGNRADAPEVSAAIAFAIAQPATLTVSVQGSGMVTTADGLIHCPSGCSHVYSSGTTVILQPTPRMGFVFAGWSSSACNRGTVLMAADHSCGATFLPAVVGRPKPGSINLDGSGLGDVLTYNPRTGVHTSQASDGLTHFVELSGGDWSVDWEVYPADFNNDGLTDFLLYDRTTGQWFKAISDGAGDFTYFTGQWSVGWQVFIVDLNGDGRSDVFLSNPESGDWYRAVSTGVGTGDFSYAAGQWTPGWRIYPAALNGDRLIDFFLHDPGTGYWYQMINDGASGFTSTLGQWRTGWAITPGDFDGDGRTDFFLSQPTTGEWSVATTQSGGFTYAHGSWSPGWTFFVGDFDGDGKADLFLYNPANGWWSEALSDGRGQFGLTFGTWSANWQVQVADFNADGFSDVLLYNPTSGGWYQAVNAGPGAFNYGSGVWEPGLVVIGSMPRVP